MPDSIERLRAEGQSIWLDFIRRAFIDAGELQRYIDRGWITGLTSNPSIFAKAIAGSTDYDEELREIAAAGGTDRYAAFVRLAVADIRRAADALRPIWESTAGVDGYVSFETPPGIEDDRDRTIAEAKRLFALIDRPNLLIKVPGTGAGIEALTQLIADGVNVNVTLLFSVDTYAQVAEAYLDGLELRLERTGDLSQAASVASLFVSRLDTAADRALPEDSALRGTVAVANARAAYHRFEQIFSGPRWTRLADAGGRVQRLLWASTGTKNPQYSDVLYVDELVAPHTVNTMPEATLRAFGDHGRGERGIPVDGSESAARLKELDAVGVNLRELTDRLLSEGLAAFATDFNALLERIGDALDTAAPPATVHSALGDLGSVVEQRLEVLAADDIPARIWGGDHTVWADDPQEITDRLGWLSSAESMSACVRDLLDFASSVRADSIGDVVLLGMGGSSLAPEVLNASLASDEGATLHLLDTTDPGAILAVARKVDPARTLVVAASKSGTTVETRSALEYFWERYPHGANFAVITDAGSPLAKLGQARGFRRVFLNQSDIGGRYSALSHFGLVPAALSGVDIGQLLNRAQEMAQACRSCVPVPENPGVWLGAVLAEAARSGRDKLTLIVPSELATFGTWVEQLIAESTGKHGTGIIPVEGEPIAAPDRYGDDRLFVAIGEHAGLDALETAGHLVARLPYTDPYQLGAEFFRWEFATAVAGHVLGIHPFNQPNVQEAKDATARVLAGASISPLTPTPAEVLGLVGAGDYIALLAYLPRDHEQIDRLQALRLRLRDQHRVATTVGFGPRYLHSTGQLHKGGPPSGVFIQIVGDDPEDAAIPGREYTFAELKQAQALGDLESLRAAGRRVARATLGEVEELAR